MDTAAVAGNAAAAEGLSDGKCAQSPPPGDAAALESLRAAVAKAEEERDAARAELRGRLRDEKVADLARKQGFQDRGYLDYLLEKNGIAPEDEAGAGAFLDRLKAETPKLFSLELHPGSGTPMPHRDGSASVRGTSPIMDLTAMLAEAPEITR